MNKHLENKFRAATTSKPAHLDPSIETSQADD